jgi:hypothetical protein
MGMFDWVSFENGKARFCGGVRGLMMPLMRCWVSNQETWPTMGILKPSLKRMIRTINWKLFRSDSGAPTTSGTRALGYEPSFRLQTWR